MKQLLFLCFFVFFVNCKDSKKTDKQNVTPADLVLDSVSIDSTIADFPDSIEIFYNSSWEKAWVGKKKYAQLLEGNVEAYFEGYVFFIKEKTISNSGPESNGFKINTNYYHPGMGYLVKDKYLLSLLAHNEKAVLKADSLFLRMFHSQNDTQLVFSAFYNNQCTSLSYVPYVEPAALLIGEFQAKNKKFIRFKEDFKCNFDGYIYYNIISSYGAPLLLVLSKVRPYNSAQKLNTGFSSPKNTQIYVLDEINPEGFKLFTVHNVEKLYYMPIKS